MFIADIPPVAHVQQVRYEFLNELIYTNKAIVPSTDSERFELTFLIQANMFKNLTSSLPKAESNYKVQAMRNYIAYLRYVSK